MITQKKSEVTYGPLTKDEVVNLIATTLDKQNPLYIAISREVDYFGTIPHLKGFEVAITLDNKNFTQSNTGKLVLQKEEEVE